MLSSIGRKKDRPVRDPNAFARFVVTHVQTLRSVRRILELSPTGMYLLSVKFNVSDYVPLHKITELSFSQDNPSLFHLRGQKSTFNLQCEERAELLSTLCAALRRASNSENVEERIVLECRLPSSFQWAEASLFFTPASTMIEHDEFDEVLFHFHDISKIVAGSSRQNKVRQ